ncbi:MAG TPA: hypothetical protein DCW97_01525 [Acidobacteria bacterium]|nr:hypothetical protein [Acidobacteriota bacterium]
MRSRGWLGGSFLYDPVLRNSYNKLPIWSEMILVEKYLVCSGRKLTRKISYGIADLTQHNSKQIFLIFTSSR